MKNVDYKMDRFCVIYLIFTRITFLSVDMKEALNISVGFKGFYNFMDSKNRGNHIPYQNLFRKIFNFDKNFRPCSK